MTGEFNIQKFGAFLKSFWGLLASFTVVLPTIIYFLNASQIKSSILSDYYLGIPTTFALLTIPFSFLFEDKLSFAKVARRIAITFSVFAFCALFSFVAIKSLYIGNRIYSEKEADGSIIKIEEKDNGEIYRRTFNSTQTDPSIH